MKHGTLELELFFEEQARYDARDLAIMNSQEFAEQYLEPTRCIGCSAPMQDTGESYCDYCRDGDPVDEEEEIPRCPGCTEVLTGNDSYCSDCALPAMAGSFEDFWGIVEQVLNPDWCPF